MLSIGKLATGQANYYLEQAEGRVDRTTSVVSGVEDDYLGGPEAAGEWLGRGAIRLGLAGRVVDRALRETLEGRHHASGLSCETVAALGYCRSSVASGGVLTMDALASGPKR